MDTSNRTLAAAATVAMAMTGAANAASLYWDVNSTDPLEALGGSAGVATGVWDAGTTANWNTNADGTGTAGLYAAGSDVFFSAGTDVTSASTVTMGGAVSAASLTIQEGSYAFTKASSGGEVSIGAGGLTVNSGVTGVTISSNTPFKATAAQDWTNNSTSSVGVNGLTLTNAVTLKAGTFRLGNNGSQTLSNAAGLVIDGATLEWNTTSAGLGGTITLKSGALGARDKFKGLHLSTLILDGNFETISSAAGSSGQGDAGSASTLKINGAYTLTTNNTFQLKSVQDLGGSVLRKAGAGTLVLTTATNTYSGGTVLTGGVLQIAGDGSLGAVPGVATTNLTFDDNATLRAAGTFALDSKRLISVAAGKTATLEATAGNTLDIAPVISGAGNVSSGATGITSLSGLNTYTGVTTVSGGSTLEVSVLEDGLESSSIGASDNAAANLRINHTGVLKYVGAATSTDRSFTLNGTSNTQNFTIDASGTGAVDFTNSATPGYGNAAQTRIFNLTGSNTGDNRLAAALTNNGSGTLTLNKNGAGKWILAGNNTFTGGININDGVLLLNGSNTSATTVAAAGTLGGTGSIKPTSSAAININGKLAPGASIGAITLDLGTTTGKVTLGSGATLEQELGDSFASDVTRFYNVLSGDVVLNANAVNLSFIGSGSLAAGTYTLMEFYSNAGSTLTDTGKPLSGLSVGSLPAGYESYDYTIDYSEVGKINLVVAVPEPASLSLLAMGGLALLRRRRA